MTSIQGWAQQPSLEEFENLLSLQESLAKQIAGVSIKEGEGSALAATKRKFLRNFKRNEKQESAKSQKRKEEASSVPNKKIFKCYKCGSTGHIKKFCRFKESNMAETRIVNAITSINFEHDCIVDSGCRHHLTGDRSKFSMF